MVGVKINLDREEDLKVLRSLPPKTMVLLSGVLYTARDQAHRRLEEDFQNGRLAVDCFRNKVIYYCGPTPAKKGRPIGSCGPTTSSRMDKYAYLTVSLGLAGVIGKGERSEETFRLFSRTGIRYLIAPGGAGAYLSTCVKKCRPFLYSDLGPEAIYELTVDAFPVVVWR